MTHFSVLVIGNYKSAMAPYDEEDPLTFRDVDEIESLRADYNESRANLVVSTDSEARLADDLRFYRQPTAEEGAALTRAVTVVGATRCRADGSEIRSKAKRWPDSNGRYEVRVHEIPSGWRLRDGAYRDVMEFSEFLEYWTGVGTFVGEHTREHLDTASGSRFVSNSAGEVIAALFPRNPSAKWDWYEVGGRWEGLLLRKDGQAVNHAKSRDIDWEAMRAAEVKEREGIVSAMLTSVGWDDSGFLSRAIQAMDIAAAQIVSRGMNPTIDEIRTELESVPDGGAGMVLLAARERSRGDFICPPNLGVKTLDEWIASTPPIWVQATLREGCEWRQLGQLGWFGTMRRAMADPEWGMAISAEVADLDPDDDVTVVDCHI